MLLTAIVLQGDIASVRQTDPNEKQNKLNYLVVVRWGTSTCVLRLMTTSTTATSTISLPITHTRNTEVSKCVRK